jgi:hypothetical protein
MQQTGVLFDQHTVNNYLGEDGQDHLQGADDRGQAHGLHNRTGKRAHKRPEPLQARAAFWGLRKRVGIVKQGGIASSAGLEDLPRQAPEANGRVGQAHLSAIHIVQHDPDTV